MTGAAPVPVPPPMPAVTKTMSAPSKQLAQPVAHLERRGAPLVGVRAAAEPARDLRAELDLGRRQVVLERLGVGVGGDELDARAARD